MVFGIVFLMSVVNRDPRSQYQIWTNSLVFLQSSKRLVPSVPRSSETYHPFDNVFYKLFLFCPNRLSSPVRLYHTMDFIFFLTCWRSTV